MTAFEGMDFGVVMPRGSAAADVRLHAAPGVRVRMTARFRQTQARSIEAFVRDDFLPVARLTIDDTDYFSAEESVPREYSRTFDVVPGRREEFAIAIPGGLETDTLFDESHGVRGRRVCERWPLRGSVSIDSVRDGEYLDMHVGVSNQSDVLQRADRATALRTSFLSLSLEVSTEGAVLAGTS
jgi:hypothetical protein